MLFWPHTCSFHRRNYPRVLAMLETYESDPEDLNKTKPSLHLQKVVGKNQARASGLEASVQPSVPSDAIHVPANNVAATLVCRYSVIFPLAQLIQRY